MNKEKFKTLLILNRVLSNTLETMSDEEKATVRGGRVFTQVHKTDLRIGKLVTKHKALQSIVESDDY